MGRRSRRRTLARLHPLPRRRYPRGQAPRPLHGRPCLVPGGMTLLRSPDLVRRRRHRRLDQLLSLDQLPVGTPRRQRHRGRRGCAEQPTQGCCSAVGSGGRHVERRAVIDTERLGQSVSRRSSVRGEGCASSPELSLGEGPAHRTFLAAGHRRDVSTTDPRQRRDDSGCAARARLGRLGVGEPVQVGDLVERRDRPLRLGRCPRHVAEYAPVPRHVLRFAPGGERDDRR